ncbi:hypothetical protein LZ31DRAFT_555701 [Colletotrichum somersetense]|nr:hypothetical protein LZ31DRAFT_555701 [Colletotrichum somersetense]
MVGMIPAWAKSTPSQWFPSVGCFVLGCFVVCPSELFPQVLYATCTIVYVFISRKYNHNRPASSGGLQLYRPAEHQPLVTGHEVAEPQPLATEHEIAEPQIPVPEHELLPNTVIGRNLVRRRMQEGLWDEFEIPKGSTLRFNQKSTVVIT